MVMVTLQEVIAYDVCEQIFIIFSSAKEYYKTFGLSKTAVTRTLRHNVIREIDSKIALYFNPENVAKLLNHVKGPANTWFP